MRKLVTPSDSPYSVSFQAGSEAFGAQAVNLDVSGAVTIILPAISTLPGTRNQQITVTNVSSNATATLLPASVDAISTNGVGGSVTLSTGVGNGLKLQPSTDHIWGSYKSQ